MYDYTDRLLPPKRSVKRGYGGPAAVVALAGILAVLLVMFGTIAAFAQNAEAEANSSSGALAQSGSQSAAGVSIVNNGPIPGVAGTTYSEARIENAPSLGGLALGGGHPCAYSPATAQISIIGGGAGIGGSKVDEACLLAVMAAAKGDKRLYTASELIIAGRSPTACRALEQAGVVTGCERTRSAAGASTEAPPPRKDFSKSSKTVEVKNTVSTMKCERVGRKKIVFRPSSAEARKSELAACKRSLGF